VELEYMRSSPAFREKKHLNHLLLFIGKTDLLVRSKKKMKKQQNMEHTTHHLSLQVNKRKN
jgi:hypothetical protein